MNHDLAISHYREHQRIALEKSLDASLREEAELRAQKNADARAVKEALKLRAAISAMRNGLKDFTGLKHDHHFCEICAAETGESENL